MVSNAFPAAKEKAEQLRRLSGLHTLLPIIAALVSSVSLLLLVQTTGVTLTGYDVRRLEQDRDDWQQINYQLESEIAGLQSLERIEKEARGKLKMVPATDFLFVAVKVTPAPVTEDLLPSSHVGRSGTARDVESWSQWLLDLLGSALGFRQK